MKDAEFGLYSLSSLYSFLCTDNNMELIKKRIRRKRGDCHRTCSKNLEKNVRILKSKVGEEDAKESEKVRSKGIPQAILFKNYLLCTQV